MLSFSYRLTNPSQEVPVFRRGEEWRVLIWGLGIGDIQSLLTTFSIPAILGA